MFGESNITMTCFNIQTESWILEKVLKFVQQFSRPEKSLEIEIKSAKMVKSCNFFFFQSYNKCFEVNFFSFWSILVNLARMFAAH